MPEKEKIECHPCDENNFRCCGCDTMRSVILHYEGEECARNDCDHELCVYCTELLRPGQRMICPCHEVDNVDREVWPSSSKKKSQKTNRSASSMSFSAPLLMAATVAMLALPAVSMMSPANCSISVHWPPWTVRKAEAQKMIVL